ncbi:MULTISPECIES: hypothetical protein [unclassified Lysobacter]|nr:MULTISPECIES: hypothetical protein [unclassified Lysobacter]HEX5664272.1 hypothetical protein [Xanthomonadaceae bacterium]
MHKTGASNDPSVAARRRAVARTAWIVAGIAVAVYLAFILSGVFGSGA